MKQICVLFARTTWKICVPTKNTTHVETVVILSPQRLNARIEVDMDATSAETKVTYAGIKDYVLKEHGLKVSNLYIWQLQEMWIRG